MEERQDILFLAAFRLLENYPHTAYTILNDGLRKRGSDHDVQLLRALARVQEGKAAEALLNLKPLQDHPLVGPAACAVLVHAYSSGLIQDADGSAAGDAARARDALDMQLKTASAAAHKLLAQVYWLTGALESAHALLDRLAVQGDMDAGTLLGWVLLSKSQGPECDDIALPHEAMECFQKSLRQQPNNVQALLGLAESQRLLMQWDASTDSLSKLMLLRPQYVLALEARMLLEIAQGDWGAATVAAEQAAQLSLPSLKALTLLVIRKMTTDGQIGGLRDALAQLKQALLEQEPNTTVLHMRIAVQLTGLGSGDGPAVKVALELASAAIQQLPAGIQRDSQLVQYARMQLLAGQYQEALASLKVPPAAPDAAAQAQVISAAACVLLGRIDEANRQLELLSLSVRPGDSSCMQRLAVQAMLALTESQPADAVVEAYDNALLEHTRRLSSLPKSPDSLSALDAAWWLLHARLLMGAMAGQPKQAKEPPSPLLVMADRIVCLMLYHAPQLWPALLLRVQVLLLQGDVSAASTLADEMLDTNPQDSNLKLLMAQIKLVKSDPEGAERCLEEALGLNFAVRQQVQFHCMQAAAKLQQNQPDAATGILEPIIAQKESKASTVQSKAQWLHFGADLQLYLLMAEAYRRKRDHQRATQVLEQARSVWPVKGMHVHLNIAQADGVLAMGDVKRALAVLEACPLESHLAIAVQLKIANLQKDHLRDNDAYLATFQRLANAHNNTFTLRLLGEAFTHIGASAQALKVLEAALESSPSDTALCKMVADTLIQMHQYRRAADLYNRAIAHAPKHLSLRLALAKLYSGVRQWQLAQEALENALLVAHGGGISAARGSYASAAENDEVLLLQLQAEMYTAQGNHASAASSYEGAFSIQGKWIERSSRNIAPQELDEARALAAQLAYSLALELKASNAAAQDVDAALEHALAWQSRHIPSLLLLAQQSLISLKFDVCQQYCKRALEADPLNKDAHMYMADVMAVQEKYGEALSHLQKLLAAKPDFKLLAQYNSMMHRAGAGKHADSILQSLADSTATATNGMSATAAALLPHAEDSNAIAKPSAAVADVMSQLEGGWDAQLADTAGLRYCQGLQTRLMGQHKTAIEHFHAALADPAWQQDAIYQLLQIYLQPELDLMWDDVRSTAAADSVAVAAARKLLEQLQPGTPQEQLKKAVWHAYAQLAGFSPTDAESGLTGLMGLLYQHQFNPMLLLAVATAHMACKQQAQADKVLRSLQTLQYSREYAWEFERAWLYQAAMGLKQGKIEQTDALAHLCLQYNKACGQAWELLAMVRDQRGMWQDAAECYSKAWQYRSECADNALDPSTIELGCKAARACCAAGKHLEAIDMCRWLTTKMPELHGRLRVDVLEKSWASVRP